MKLILNFIYFVLVCVPLACCIYAVAILIQEAKSIFDARQQKNLCNDPQEV